ncbi:Neurofibromin 1 [Balamuthia mandrillaris]
MKITRLRLNLRTEENNEDGLELAGELSCSPRSPVRLLPSPRAFGIGGGSGQPDQKRTPKSPMDRDRQAIHLRENMQKLETFILEEEVLLQALLELAKSSEMDQLATALVHIFLGHDRGHKLRNFVIKEGVQKYKSRQLLRDTNIYVTILSEYGHATGQKFIQRVLSHTVNSILTSNLRYEMDPLRFKEGDDAEVNLLNVMTAARGMLDSIFNHILSLPRDWAETMKLIYEQLRIHQETTPFDVIGSYMFLRLLCPVIVSPYHFGLHCRSGGAGESAQQPSVTPENLRGLILVAKLVQNVANRVEETEKEDYLRSTQELVHTYIMKLEDIADQIISAEKSNGKTTHQETAEDADNSPPPRMLFTETEVRKEQQEQEEAKPSPREPKEKTSISRQHSMESLATCTLQIYQHLETYRKELSQFIEQHKGVEAKIRFGCLLSEVSPHLRTVVISKDGKLEAGCNNNEKSDIGTNVWKKMQRKIKKSGLSPRSHPQDDGAPPQAESFLEQKLSLSPLSSPRNAAHSNNSSPRKKQPTEAIAPTPETTTSMSSSSPPNAASRRKSMEYPHNEADASSADNKKKRADSFRIFRPDAISSRHNNTNDSAMDPQRPLPSSSSPPLIKRKMSADASLNPVPSAMSNLVLSSKLYMFEEESGGGSAGRRRSSSFGDCEDILPTSHVPPIVEGLPMPAKKKKLFSVEAIVSPRRRSSSVIENRAVKKYSPRGLQALFEEKKRKEEKKKREEEDIKKKDEERKRKDEAKEAKLREKAEKHKHKEEEKKRKEEEKEREREERTREKEEKKRKKEEEKKKKQGENSPRDGVNGQPPDNNNHNTNALSTSPITPNPIHKVNEMGGMQPCKRGRGTRVGLLFEKLQDQLQPLTAQSSQSQD